MSRNSHPRPYPTHVVLDDGTIINPDIGPVRIESAADRYRAAAERMARRGPRPWPVDEEKQKPSQKTSHAGGMPVKDPEFYSALMGLVEEATHTSFIDLYDYLAGAWNGDVPSRSAAGRWVRQAGGTCRRAKVRRPQHQVFYDALAMAVRENPEMAWVDVFRNVAADWAGGHPCHSSSRRWCLQNGVPIKHIKRGPRRLADRQTETKDKEIEMAQKSKYHEFFQELKTRMEADPGTPWVDHFHAMAEERDNPPQQPSAYNWLKRRGVTMTPVPREDRFARGGRAAGKTRRVKKTKPVATAPPKESKAPAPPVQTALTNVPPVKMECRGEMHHQPIGEDLVQPGDDLLQPRDCAMLAEALEGLVRDLRNIPRLQRIGHKLLRVLEVEDCMEVA